ncbi:MAG TPA: hypothetical protein VGR29_12695 [Thermomicrobiales bacterium]|nr:hypothetical protein [Thermomicrobiales bacterium]
MALHARVHPRTRLLLAALLPALATAVMLIPPLFGTTGPGPGRSLALFWLLVFVVSAPMVAFVVNWHWPAATTANRAFLAALPQPVVVPLMLWLAVSLDIQRGNLVRDTSEEAMTSGFATVGGLLIGLILMILVAVGGQLGARLVDR